MAGFCAAMRRMQFVAMVGRRAAVAHCISGHRGQTPYGGTVFTTCVAALGPDKGSDLCKPVPGRGLALGRGLGPNTAFRLVNCPANRLNTAFFAPAPAQTAISHCRFRQMRRKNACFPVAVSSSGHTSPGAAFCGIVEAG
jgi:hypothetical protein